MTRLGGTNGTTTLRMIALCGEHHPKADAGTFSKEELREFKQAAGPDNLAVRGRFDWMREKLLAVIGGNFYYETPVPLTLNSIPVIAFNRDSAGRFMLNVQMPSTRPNDLRMLILQNDWIETGQPVDLESPPSGKLLRAQYADGDTLRVEFKEAASEAILLDRYPDAALERHLAMQPGSFEYPLLTVIITMRLGDNVDLGDSATRILGMTMTGSMMSHCQFGMYF